MHFYTIKFEREMTDDFEVHITSRLMRQPQLSLAQAAIDQITAEFAEQEIGGFVFHPASFVIDEPTDDDHYSHYSVMAHLPHVGTAKELCQELQQAYDDGVAGQFKITGGPFELPPLFVVTSTKEA